MSVTLILQSVIFSQARGNVEKKKRTSTQRCVGEWILWKRTVNSFASKQEHQRWIIPYATLTDQHDFQPFKGKMDARAHGFTDETCKLANQSNKNARNRGKRIGDWGNKYSASLEMVQEKLHIHGINMSGVILQWAWITRANGFCVNCQRSFPVSLNTGLFSMAWFAFCSMEKKNWKRQW